MAPLKKGETNIAKDSTSLSSLCFLPAKEERTYAYSLRTTPEKCSLPRSAHRLPGNDHCLRNAPGPFDGPQRTGGSWAGISHPAAGCRAIDCCLTTFLPFLPCPTFRGNPQVPSRDR